MAKSDKKTGTDTRKWLLDQCAGSLAKEIVRDETFWLDFQYALQRNIERISERNDKLNKLIDKSTYQS